MAAPAIAAGGGIYYLLQSTHDINYYFKAQPPEFILALAAVGLLGLGCGALWVRYFVIWLFIVPVSLFENKTFLGALRRSAELAKGSFWRLLALMAGWTAALGLVTGTIMALAGAPEVTDEFPRIEYPYFRSKTRAYYRHPAILAKP